MRIIEIETTDYEFAGRLIDWLNDATTKPSSTVMRLREAPAEEINADLLAACEELVDEHRLFGRGDYWVCPFCGVEALDAVAPAFPHVDDCPVALGRAAIAKATPAGQTDGKEEPA